MAELYVKFETPAVDGGSTTEGHEGDLEIHSWSHSFSLPVVGFSPDGRVQGAASVTDVSMVFELNSATVPMLNSVFKGSNFAKVTLSCYRASGADTTATQQAYLVVTMENVICSHVSNGGSMGGDTGMVTISLNCAKIQYEYDPQKPDSGAEGKLAVQYDLILEKVA